MTAPTTTSCIAAEPDWAKGHYRLAAALLGAKDLCGAARVSVNAGVPHAHRLRLGWRASGERVESGWLGWRRDGLAARVGERCLAISIWYMGIATRKRHTRYAKIKAPPPYLPTR